MSDSSRAATACTAAVAKTWGPVPPPPPGCTWEGLMDEALTLARQGEAAGEVPVGALVVAPDGRTVGRAHNAPAALHDPTAHAEVLALRAAGQTLGNYRLTGCVLVVTLEPCLMCTGALVHARVAGLVYGAADLRAGAAASTLHGLDLPMHAHRPWHMGGIRASDCAAVLQHFFASRRDDILPEQYRGSGPDTPRSGTMTARSRNEYSD